MLKKSMVLMILMSVYLLGCNPIAVAKDEKGLVSCEIGKIKVRRNRSQEMQYIVFGKLTVFNQLREPMNFHLKDVVLIIDDARSLGLYLDSVASRVEEYRQIIIEPHSEQAYRVYWVFEEPVNSNGKFSLLISENH